MRGAHPTDFISLAVINDSYPILLGGSAGGGRR